MKKLNMRNFTSAAALAAAAFVSSFCGPSSAFAADGGAKGTSAEWTIMVYLNAKNNLEPDAFTNFFQMESVGSNADVNVVVQFGRLGTYSTKDGAWKGCRRYLVGYHPSDTNTISSPIISSTSVCDMGDYNNAIDFFTWAKAAYPANHYMAMIWNHGSGWEKSARKRVRGISYDDESDNHITTPQMGSILAALGHVDVYSSDACLMQMPEVGYEIKDYVDYIVGSEENEPSEGYQYANFLTAVNASDFTPRAVAKAAVDTYIDQYSAAYGVTHSYIDASTLPGFVSRLNTFASSLMTANEQSVARTARAAVFDYGSAGDRDISHFAALVSSATATAAVKTAAQDLVTYTKGSVILYNKTKGSDYANSYGLSIYLPETYAVNGYNELAFAQNTNWLSFINWIVSTARVDGTVTADGLPLAGVTVSASGASSVSAVTDSAGKYAMALTLNGSYSLSASKAGYSFSPLSVSTASLKNDWTGNNFTASPANNNVLLHDIASYPNPFAALKGEKANLHYTLDVDREARIRIYNPAGELVWEHTSPAGSSGGQAGANEVQWDGRNGDGKTVGRGIYLAAIEAGGARVIVKVGVR